MAGPGNALFAFYSHEGNCRQLAELMAGKTGGDVDELRPIANPVPATGVMKYVAGGRAALFNGTVELAPLAHDMATYQLVVVGGPVWFGRIAPAVRSFMINADWSGKKAAVFSMYRGGKGKALRIMEKLITDKGGTVVASASFIDLRRGNPEQTRAEAVAWAENALAGQG
ncbi:MAG: hypothetical protein LIP23_10530 [Planctomycetes bacterium]|nr:hypothetical protein [Planctomycetota bacterium]